VNGSDYTICQHLLPCGGTKFSNTLVTEGEETALVATTNLLLIRRGFVPREKPTARGAHRGYQDPPNALVANALQNS